MWTPWWLFHCFLCVSFGSWLTCSIFSQFHTFCILIVYDFFLSFLLAAQCMLHFSFIPCSLLVHSTLLNSNSQKQENLIGYLFLTIIQHLLSVRDFCKKILRIKLNIRYNTYFRGVRDLLLVLPIWMHLGQQLHLTELWTDQLPLERTLPGHSLLHVHTRVFREHFRDVKWLHLFWADGKKSWDLFLVKNLALSQS